MIRILPANTTLYEGLHRSDTYSLTHLQAYYVISNCSGKNFECSLSTNAFLVWFATIKFFNIQIMCEIHLGHTLVPLVA